MQRLTLLLSKRIYGFSLTDLAVIGFLCVLLVTPAAIAFVKNETVHYVEIKIVSSREGHVLAFYDFGHGYSPTPIARKYIAKDQPDLSYRFIIPPEPLCGLRLQLIDSPTRVGISALKIVSKGGVVIRTLNTDDIIVEGGVEEIVRSGDTLTVATVANATPLVRINLSPPIIIRLQVLPIIFGVIGRFAMVYAIAIFLAVAIKYSTTLRPLAKLRAFAQGIIPTLQARPPLAIAVVALLAVVINCYPIVFLGRSFVSPNFGTALLYERTPTLPGFQDTIVENNNGSDIGAMIWYYVPLSMVQHRAIFRDGELPLWNRFNSAGLTLLGQGQSMFGDPLHMLVIAANGAAWAWDLKFLIAKWLLALALGLIVLQGTRHLPAAALTAFSAPFIGFFLYRLNHPAFFSFCYAPWILYCWCRLGAAPTWRKSAIWSAGLLVSCWSEVNSGTVKEAYILLLSMNLSGCIVLLFCDIAGKAKFKKLLLAAWTGGLLILISAPVWLTFLDALRDAYTLSDSRQAFQIHPVVLLGLFDEVFFRPLNGNNVYSPAANFFVLLGVLYAIATFRRTPKNHLKLAIAIGGFIPLAIAFGLIPPDWIVKVPFVANIIHTHDVFSPVLIIHLIVIAGFGYHAASLRLGTSEGRGDWITCWVLLAALVYPYIALTHNTNNSAFPVLYWTTRLPVTPFVWLSLAFLLAASAVLTLVTRRSLQRGGWSLARAILAVTCLVVLLWRQGPNARIGFDKYVFHPSGRADFHATAPVIEAMTQNRDDPSRATGFEGILFPGWTGVYSIEGICGPDALVNPYYRELLESCGFDRPWEWRYAVHVGTLAKIKPVYDFLNIKYYLGLERDRTQINPTLRTVKTDNADEVFASDTVWPRAFFTDRLAVYDTATEMGQFVRNGDGRPFAAIQSIDRKLSTSLSPNLLGRTIVPARDYRFTNNTTSFNVTATGPGVIVLQESWLKQDFRVKVNGRPTSYLRINHAFKGIEIDAAGTFEVTFAYWPRHFSLALMLAVVGALLFIAGTCWLWIMDRESKPQVPAIA